MACPRHHRCAQLEREFAANISAAEATWLQHHYGSAPLGVRLTGAVLLALLDDEPHARLDAKNTPTTTLS
jgi:hypothetical protein